MTIHDMLKEYYGRKDCVINPRMPEAGRVNTLCTIERTKIMSCHDHIQYRNHNNQMSNYKPLT